MVHRPDDRVLALPPLPLARIARRPLPARFVARPNRFVSVVELEGREVEVHVPNPGRLSGTLVPGCSVLLDGPYPAPRRLAYTMLAAREGRTWVGTVTTYANRVFPSLLPLFPELPDGPLAAEVTHGASRFDFRLGDTLVEVKSVTLRAGEVAAFPDAVTARGARHVGELTALARRRRPVAVVFVAQRGDVSAIRPEPAIDPLFARALADAARAGVTLLGCALTLGPGGARTARRLPVIV